MKYLLKPSFLSNEYLVCDEGYVLCKNGTHKLHGSINRYGYMIVTLMVNGKRISIGEHTLVARAFCNGYKDGLQVNHLNGIRNDNRACNLEWCTASENMRHSVDVLGHHTGIGNANHRGVDVFCYKTNKFICHYDCIAEMCRDFLSKYTSVKQRHIENNVWMVIHNLRHSYYGFTFKYS